MVEELDADRDALQHESDTTREENEKLQVLHCAMRLSGTGVRDQNEGNRADREGENFWHFFC